jgi:hypothetical protein
MGADEPEKREKRDPAGPATGERTDRDPSPPGVDMPNEPDTQPAEEVPDPDAAEERGDE